METTRQGMSRKRCLRMESVLQLPHEVVERILEKLAVKSLLRFKSVSKQWRSTIESQFFQGRDLTHRQRSGDPDVLMVFERAYQLGTDTLRTLVLGSSSSVKIPAPWEETDNKLSNCVSHNSCDGLLCLFNPYKAFVVNPATRWYRALPPCNFQQPIHQSLFKLGHSFSRLGFGKDIFTNTYKPVWLYNSFGLGLENATTCEVFEYTTNAWRYVTPSAPYRVLAPVKPVFVDGSLYWLTDCKETKVVSFNLHTEAFQVISNAHFLNFSNPYTIVMCNLDKRLCVSERMFYNQVIWSFSSSYKTWDKMYSIDFGLTVFWHDGRGIPNYPSYALMPLAILKKKLLFYDPKLGQLFFTRDSEIKRDEVAFSARSSGLPVCYSLQENSRFATELCDARRSSQFCDRFASNLRERRRKLQIPRKICEGESVANLRGIYYSFASL
ncbi:PREDICTED: F-box/LRR-repeat/kelch-repeat protein At1g09650-like [Camelina sativa]|uniref:F-box/LRR-repeat/kelch-repeat protein At1g09650-like n=1 Tax=Camelina sativa TaxID=90675 RepID=A0ABM0XXL4_CAMSA|nr:PREDICTED: F-box/LRR-repeat/kelch-repeat protein At1g09650-like [Camelina sativa]